jgi:deoxyhypusine synthase
VKLPKDDPDRGGLAGATNRKMWSEMKIDQANSSVPIVARAVIIALFISL